MFNIFKNVIETSDFDLRDILNKIEESYIKSSLSKEEQEELEEMARKHAKPENSYADVQKQIDDLAQKIEELQVTINANAQGMSAIKEAVEREYLGINFKLVSADKLDFKLLKID